jgi:hypothetical protein
MDRRRKSNRRRAGEALCIPRGAVHRFDNNANTDAKALCVITPAAIGPQYFRETFALLKAAAGGPPDKAKMLEIMQRHGLSPALPPTSAIPSQKGLERHGQ